MKDVLDTAVKTVKFMKVRPVNQELFMCSAKKWIVPIYNFFIVK